MTTWGRVGLAKRDIFFVFGCFGLGERIWVWLSRDIVIFWGSFFSCFVGSFSLVGWGRGRRGLRKVVFMGKGGGEGLCIFDES